MTTDSFDALLARRDELEAEHTEWCREVNGPCGFGEGSYESRRRDQVYTELEQTQGQIDAALEAEAEEGK